MTHAGPAHALEPPAGHAPARHTPGARSMLCALAVAACLAAQAVPAAATESGPVVSRGVTIPAFYQPPATLPAADGAIVRSEPLRLALSLPGLGGRRSPAPRPA